VRIGTFAALIAVAATASVFTQALTFEVVSVKRNTSGAIGSSGSGDRPDGSFTLRNVPITTLIARAYPSNMPIPVYDLQGLPDWAKPGKEYYDIAAKSPLSRPVTPAERTGMLRALLADRFKLAVHTESRPQNVYQVVLARKDGRLGPNLKPSEIDCVAKLAADQAAGIPPWRPTLADMQGGGGPPPGTCAVFNMNGRMEGDMTMESLAAMLGIQTGMSTGDIRRGIDKTGLTGSYRLKMQYDPATLRRGFEATPDAGTSFFTALQEQLGLKIEPAKISQEMLVIDHIERPTDD